MQPAAEDHRLPNRAMKPVKTGQGKTGQGRNKIRRPDCQGSSLPWRRGKLATAILLINVFFGERLEHRRVQLAGVVLFADALGRHGGVHTAKD